jgi:uncharacterized membrane protein YfcA
VGVHREDALMDFWLPYLVLGAFAGFLAGLLGVGGGLVIVPVLAFLFTTQHFNEANILHLALGTSLASIIFTSLSSVRAHHAHGALDCRMVLGITPGIVTGTLLGSVLAAHLSTAALKLFFVAFLFYAATQMVLDIRPKAHQQLPGKLGMFSAGNVIGAVSSLVGIGGGTLSVPFMLWCNVAMHRAIGTSAAIGFPIAIAGAAGYILNGMAADNLPAHSLGFIYLPALAGIALASIITAPLGARTTHRLPVKRLKKIFAVLLYLLGIQMAASLL